MAISSLRVKPSDILVRVFFSAEAEEVEGEEEIVLPGTQS